MLTRACISINNRCNLSCKYCHFHQKKAYIREAEMDIITILDNITTYIEEENIKVFKLGFVGNGEPLLDFEKLKKYILYIAAYLKAGTINAYVISNGLLIDHEKLEFFKTYNINIGFSIDGLQPIHDKNRCQTHKRVMEKIELYRAIYNKYPSMNCTVGRDILENQIDTIKFFQRFENKITFSRMIGEEGISLLEFNEFLHKAIEYLDVRIGGYDCTMYGGLCAAGIDNVFYANGRIYICGNCIDLPFSLPASTPLKMINFDIKAFDRKCCFKEVFRS